MPLLLCIVIGIISGPFISLQSYLAVAGGLFLLISGFEIDLRQLGGERKLIGKLWLGAFVPPLAIGVALPFVLPKLFLGPPGVGVEDTAFILGIALAVSAVPVVIKIMQEMGWTGTQRAQRVIVTAVLCDVAAWLLFFFVLPSEGQTPWLFSHWPLLMFFVGILVVHLWPQLRNRMATLAVLNRWMFGPIFFIGVGQALDFSNGASGMQLLVVFAAATLSKTLGVWAVGRFAGLPQEEAFALGLALNARGAMEILMAKFALSAGVITNDFFISLVFMALATSLMIRPIFRWRRRSVVA